MQNDTNAPDVGKKDGLAGGDVTSRWTSEVPRIDGWYWHRFSPPSKPTVECVYFSDWGSKLRVNNDGEREWNHDTPDEMKGEWAGPLTEPANNLPVP